MGQEEQDPGVFGWGGQGYQSRTHKGGPRGDPEREIDPTRGKLLEKIFRDLPEQKVVKSDNAEVPDYLWEDHLVDDNVCNWSPPNQVGLLGAMKLLRERMLRWWKKPVTTSYLHWLKEEHPRLRKFDAGGAT
jgi:hypothetical protein